MVVGNGQSILERRKIDLIDSTKWAVAALEQPPCDLLLDTIQSVECQANWFVDDERDDWDKTMQLILGSSFCIYADRNDSLAMIDAYTHFAEIATKISEDES